MSIVMSSLIFASLVFLLSRGSERFSFVRMLKSRTQLKSCTTVRRGRRHNATRRGSRFYVLNPQFHGYLRIEVKGVTCLDRFRDIFLYSLVGTRSQVGVTKSTRNREQDNSAPLRLSVCVYISNCKREFPPGCGCERVSAD